MKRSRGFVCAALAVTIAFSAAAFAACGGGDDSEIYEEDEIVPIALQDDYAAEKVVTQGFAVGTVTEEKGAFALPRLVGDNMLLQANVVNRVWGQSSENGEIAAQILKKDGSAEAVYYGTVQNGVFEIWLGKHGYGSGYGLRLVTKSGKSVTLKNVDRRRTVEYGLDDGTVLQGHDFPSALSERDRLFRKRRYSPVPRVLS